MTKIPTWKSFKYREVYKIIQMKDGAVYRTQSLGVYIDKDKVKLPQGYTSASISTDMVKDKDFIYIEIVPQSFFDGKD